VIGRLPLWATLVPLVAGILVWFILWGGHRDRLVADMQQLLPAGTQIATSGFPYRLVATVKPLDIGRDDVAVSGRLQAAEVSVNRQPWQPNRQVMNLTDSIAQLAIKPFSGAGVRIVAGKAQASLRLEGGRIARLSAVWEKPEVTTGLLPVAITADSFEAHFRETPGSGGNSANPRLPTQDQLVLAGTAVRLGGGDPLKLSLDSEITARGPVRSFATWGDGGTVEIRSLSLADATGEVARIQATVVPGASGGLRIAGTIETVCPANVRAAIAGLSPVSEKRARKAVLLPFEGSLPGSISIPAADPAKPPPPVRGQEPACPRLRGI